MQLDIAQPFAKPPLAKFALWNQLNTISPKLTQTANLIISLLSMSYSADETQNAVKSSTPSKVDKTGPLKGNSEQNWTLRIAVQTQYQQSLIYMLTHITSRSPWLSRKHSWIDSLLKMRFWTRSGAAFSPKK